MHWAMCQVGDEQRITTLVALPADDALAMRYVPQAWGATPPAPSSEPAAPAPLPNGYQAPASPQPLPVLDGDLALAIASMTDLRALHLSGVGLRGMLPALWGASLPQLVYLNLSHNQLGGGLPATYGRLGNLHTLYVGGFTVWWFAP